AATLADDETPIRQLAQSLPHHAAGHAVGGLQLVFGGQWGARWQRLAVDLLPDRVPDLHIERAVAAFESHATPPPSLGRQRTDKFRSHPSLTCDPGHDSLYVLIVRTNHTYNRRDKHNNRRLRWLYPLRRASRRCPAG